ncbi:MAG: hypothetical protein WD512_05420, partial [Candidatus Paceibacterota bacterium]
QTIIKKFPEGSLASIEIATTTPTLSPPPATPLTTIKFATRNKNRPPQHQFTPEQVDTAIQGAQNSLQNQSSMLPSTSPEAQMMNPGVALQVGSGRKVKMGSFYMDDTDIDADMMGGGSSNKDPDKDLINKYITIEDDNRDNMIDRHFLDDNETEEIIINPKKQRK